AGRRGGRGGRLARRRRAGGGCAGGDRASSIAILSEFVEPSDVDDRLMTRDDFQKGMARLNKFQTSLAIQGKLEPSGSGRTLNGYSWDTTEPGVYASVVSAKPLFSSAAKYDSGTGWASFWAPIDASSVVERICPRDKRTKPKEQWRVEVLDRASMTKVGYVFPDGPEPSGKRYRINAGVMAFVPSATPPKADVAQARAGWSFEAAAEDAAPAVPAR
ncbi:unnamed protein product, partial [Prorocentrum cordatum]